MGDTELKPMLFVERTVRSATERAIAALEVAVSELTSTLPDHKMVPIGRDFVWELGELPWVERKKKQAGEARSRWRV
jgi:hypothetical protein